MCTKTCQDDAADTAEADRDDHGAHAQACDDKTTNTEQRTAQALDAIEPINRADVEAAAKRTEVGTTAGADRGGFHPARCSTVT